MVFAHIPFRRRRHRQCAGPCFAAQRRTCVAASATIQSNSESAGLGWATLQPATTGSTAWRIQHPQHSIHSMAHTASTAQHPQHGTYSNASATIQSNSESAATEHSKAKKAKLSHCAAAPDSTAAMHVLQHDVLSSPSSRLRTSWAGSHARHVPELRESHDSQLPRLLLVQSCSLLHSKPTLTSADRPSRLLRFDWRSVSDDHS